MAAKAWFKSDPHFRRAIGLSIFTLLATVAISDDALANGPTDVDVTISVATIASVEFVNAVPQFCVTVFSNGSVSFRTERFFVSGNGVATASALPVPFIQVPAQGWLGRAETSGSDVIGFNIILEFPRFPVTNSPAGSAQLPKTSPDPTTPPLSADLTLTSGQREGRVVMNSNAFWTETGNQAVAGTYCGSVQLTVTPGS